MISGVNTKQLKIPIRVNGISNGEHQFLFDVEPKELGLPEQFRISIHVRADMEKSSTGLVLNVSVETQALYQCDRCLGDLDIPVRAEFHLFYAKDEESVAATPDGSETLVLDPNEPFIDIGPDVVDYCLIKIPLRKVCEEFNPDNASCMTELKKIEESEDRAETDPRWSALKNLNLEE
jgi:DUF177 domain-containing protein